MLALSKRQHLPDVFDSSVRPVWIGSDHGPILPQLQREVAQADRYLEILRTSAEVP
jgi:hypothetical protein